MAVNLVIEVEGDIEKALRTMKKKMLKDGMFQEMKKRAYYEKPSVKRRRKAATALKVPQESPRDARARRARRRQEETEMGDGRTVKVIDGNIEAALKKLKRLGREFVPMAAMSPSEEKHWDEQQRERTVEHNQLKREAREMREYEQARIKERISPEVAERLKLWFEEREEALGRKLSLDEPLLLTAKGDRLTRGGLSDYMISIGRAARIKRFEVTSHVFRHTKNVIRRLAGLDSLQRSALLGHTNPGSLTAYEKLMPQELVGARQRETEGLAAYLADTDEGDYDDGISGMRALPPSPVSKPVKKLKG